MEGLGPGDDRASPASSTRSLDLRLSARDDSAYSSFSAASGGPEPRTPSPGPDPLPYLDWDYVRVVWGGPSPAPPDAGPRSCPRPRPAVAARCGPRPPAVQGTPGPLSRQATPLLYALAAEAEAATRAVEPPSPPASRAAYRQRLQGAQRRVLRETSFQRKELRMSLPARLRPAAPARQPTEHPRSASLSHPGGEVERPRCPAPAPGTADPERLASQQRKWCFSEPGKLDRLGRGVGAAGECLGEASTVAGGPVGPQLAGCKGLPEIQPQGPADCGSQKFAPAYRPAGRSRSASSEALGPWGGPGGTMSVAQALPHRAQLPRPVFQTKVSSSKNFLPSRCGGCETPASRCSTQKEAAVTCPTELPAGSPADSEQRVSEICRGPTRLPSLPDDEVFLEEASMGRVTSPPGSQAEDTRASDEQNGTGLGHGAGRVPAECPLHRCPGSAEADEGWQGVNGSVGVCGPTGSSTPGTANGDIPTSDPPGVLATEPPATTESDPMKPLPVDGPGSSDSHTQGPVGHTALGWGTGQPGSWPAWSSQRLEELVQELARLDPSLSDTLAAQPSAEPPLGLLDGLIPSAEVWAAMSAAEDAAGTSESGSNQLSSPQLLPTSQETRSEDPGAHPVPDQLCGQGLPAPHSSLQARKVELADLLQKMLGELHAEQERLHHRAHKWASGQAALEAAVGQACAPRELERFRRFLADLERVLGLLLLLGSRLVRVRRALARAGSDGDPDEHASVLQRFRLLQRQQEDAKELKEHVARRERALREALERALPAEHLRSYCALLAGKAAILAQQRSLDERVRLLQDRLDAIGRDLGRRPLSPRLVWPSGTCPRDDPPFPPPMV